MVLYVEVPTVVMSRPVRASVRLACRYGRAACTAAAFDAHPATAQLRVPRLRKVATNIFPSTYFQHVNAQIGAYHIIGTVIIKADTVMV
jgi:hypothetical protein